MIPILSSGDDLFFTGLHVIPANDGTISMTSITSGVSRHISSAASQATIQDTWTPYKEPRVELESQKVSETSLSHHFSTLTETGLRNVILALPRLVSETFFSFLTETRLGDLFSTLLRLVS